MVPGLTFRLTARSSGCPLAVEAKGRGSFVAVSNSTTGDVVRLDTRVEVVELVELVVEGVVFVALDVDELDVDELDINELDVLELDDALAEGGARRSSPMRYKLVRIIKKPYSNKAR